MLETYIIEKLKREKERQEQEQWQPIHLPLEEYESENRIERPKKERDDDEKDPRGFVVIRLQSCNHSEKLVL